MESMKTTNAEKKTFAPITSSVLTAAYPIMPDRFGSISTPNGMSLVTPGLASVSDAQVTPQKPTEPQ